MGNIRPRLGLGPSFVILASLVLAQCATAVAPSTECPEGEAPDSAGNCQPVEMPCEGDDCLDGGMMDAGPELCEENVDCDDDIECTEDACNSDGSCTNAAKANGLPCDFGGVAGICSSGVCEDAGLCRDVDCSDGVDCTEDLCVNGVCTGNVPDDDFCDDGDSCTASLCNPIGGCTNPQLPDYSACDDGASATTPDVCRAGACIGAVQGSMSSVSIGTAIDIVKTNSKYVVLVNGVSSVELHELTAVSSSAMLGSRGGTGNRLHARGNEVYVAAQTNGPTSGGLNCTSEFDGPCPIVGVYPGSGEVQWNGTPLHNALNGLGMSGVHDIDDITINELVICEDPPCGPSEDIHWWFVGQRLGLNARPHIVYCFQATPTIVNCQISIGASYNKAIYDGFRFVGVEVPVSSSSLVISPPEYNTGVFGLQEGPATTVKVDPDNNPSNGLSDGVRFGPFDTALRGSFERSCNMVIEYGNGGSVLCQSRNVSPISGCRAEVGTAWTCGDLVTGENFVHGTVAGRPLLVTPRKVFVQATGSTSDPATWVPIEFELEAGVTLAAAAGDNSQWYIIANDSNTRQVKVFWFTW